MYIHKIKTIHIIKIVSLHLTQQCNQISNQEMQFKGNMNILNAHLIEFYGIDNKYHSDILRRILN